MKNVLLVSSLILLLSFYSTVNAECVQEQTGGGEVIGTLLGAALGGLVGSQFGGGTGNKVFIGAGVLAGGLLGNKRLVSHWIVRINSIIIIQPRVHLKRKRQVRLQAG